MVAVHRTQQKGSHLSRAAKLQELPRMRQRANRTLRLLDTAMKPDLKLRQRDMWDKALVKTGERQAEFSPKPIQRNLRPIGLFQNVISGLQHRWQIIHQRSRPIENNIPDHQDSVAA